jgi:AraC-like DNA-binding protein
MPSRIAISHPDRAVSSAVPISSAEIRCDLPIGSYPTGLLQDGVIDMVRTSRYDGDVLAERFGVVPRQLCEFFELVVCKSVSHWMMEVRLWDAAQLLCDDRSVAESAEVLFFKTTSDFHREFQRYHESSPNEFVAAHRRIERRRRNELEQFFGAENFPEEMYIAPWTRALHIIAAWAGTREAEATNSVPGRCFLIYRLHLDLCAGREPARELLADLLRQSLIQRLCREFPYQDSQNVVDAVDGALMDLFQRPKSVDPKRGGLEQFTHLASRRNLMNLSESENRRRTRERLAVMDFLRLFENSCATSPSPLDEMIQQAMEAECGRIWEIRERWLKEFINGLSDRDRGFIELRLNGVRNFAPYVELLAIADLPKLCSGRRSIK